MRTKQVRTFLYSRVKGWICLYICIYWIVIQRVTFRLYQLSLTGGKVISAAAAAALCCLCIPSSPDWLAPAQSRSLLLWHPRHKQWHTPMITSHKCFQSQLIFFFSQTFAFISTCSIFHVWLFELLRCLIRVAVCSKRKKNLTLWRY